MAIFRGPRDIGRYLAAGELHGEVKIERREAVLLWKGLYLSLGQCRAARH